MGTVSPNYVSWVPILIKSESVLTPVGAKFFNSSGGIWNLGGAWPIDLRMAVRLVWLVTCKGGLKLVVGMGRFMGRFFADLAKL